MTSLATLNCLTAAPQHLAVFGASLCPRTATAGRSGAGSASSSGRLPAPKAMLHFAPSKRRLRRRKAGSRSSTDEDEDDFTDNSGGGGDGGSYSGGGFGGGGSGSSWNSGGSSDEGWNRSWNNSTELLAIFYEIGWIWVMFSGFSLVQALHFLFSGLLRKSVSVCATA
jgi:hypothetical protein